jgi:hypothetical protein
MRKQGKHRRLVDTGQLYKFQINRAVPVLVVDSAPQSCWQSSLAALQPCAPAHSDIEKAQMSSRISNARKAM